MSLNDDLSIALFSCSILIVLDHISELSSFIVTYHSDKWNVYEISASNRLTIALCLNLLVFYIHDLFTLCMKIYLSTFIITYVLSAVHSESWDLVLCLATLSCFFFLKDPIRRNWVKWIILCLSFCLVVLIYCDFLLQTEWRLMSYHSLQYVSQDK